MKDLVKRMDSKEDLCGLVDDLLKDPLTSGSHNKTRCLQQVRKTHCKFVLKPVLIRDVQEEAKEKILRFMQSVLFKKKTPPKRISFAKYFYCDFLKVVIPFPKRVPKKVSRNLLDLIKDFEKNNLGTERDTVHIEATCWSGHMEINENNFKNSVSNPRALVNWNMTLSNFSNIAFWVAEQERFVHSLDWEHKLILFFYTYGGDKMVNNFLLGQEIDSRNYIPEKDSSDVDTPYVRFLSSKIYPLSLFLYRDMVGCRQARDILRRHGMVPEHFKARVEVLWKNVKNKSFYQAYQNLFFFFVENREDFPPVILRNYTQEFTETLNDILHRAPKTNIQFWVFRGISKKDYVVIGNEKRYVFTNKPFMSTSLDLCSTADFKDERSSCCIQQILVPKGVTCLFISLLSSFRDEKEILFPPDSYLFPISDDYLATNVNVETRKFTIAN